LRLKIELGVAALIEPGTLGKYPDDIKWFGR